MCAKKKRKKRKKREKEKKAKIKTDGHWRARARAARWALHLKIRGNAREQSASIKSCRRISWRFT
jgi:hypothetical protein